MSKAAELANLIGNINAGGGGVNRNLIINGAMNVAQRGTSSTGIGASSGYFTVDRFQLGLSSTAGRLTMTQDSSAPSGFSNSLKLECTTADTSIAAGELLLIQHKIEAQNCQQFAKGTSDAKPFAVSFYVKGNASATYVAELVGDDVSRQISKTFNVTTDWTRVELTYPADTTGAITDDNGIGLTLNFWLHAGSTYKSGTLSETWTSVTEANRAVGISSFFDSTDRTFFLTGVQVEVGQNPTEFEHEPFDVTLIKAKRYFEKFDYENTGFVRTGYSNATTSAHSAFEYAEKRAAPTVTLPTAGQSSGNVSFLTGTGGYPSSTGTHSFLTANKTNGRIQAASYSGLTAAQPSAFYSTGSTSIEVDAEL